MIDARTWDYDMDEALDASVYERAEASLRALARSMNRNGSRRLVHPWALGVALAQCRQLLLHPLAKRASRSACDDAAPGTFPETPRPATEILVVGGVNAPDGPQPCLSPLPAPEPYEPPEWFRRLPAAAPEVEDEKTSLRRVIISALELGPRFARHLDHLSRDGRTAIRLALRALVREGVVRKVGPAAFPKYALVR